MGMENVKIDLKLLNKEGKYKLKRINTEVKIRFKLLRKIDLC